MREAERRSERWYEAGWPDDRRERFWRSAATYAAATLFAFLVFLTGWLITGNDDALTTVRFTGILATAFLLLAAVAWVLRRRHQRRGGRSGDAS